MQLARVIGTVVATVKNESLHRRKLLVVQSLNKDLKPQGKPLVAVDAAERCTSMANLRLKLLRKVVDNLLPASDELADDRQGRVDVAVCWSVEH